MAIVNGKIRINPPYGVDVEEVARILGEGTPDAGVICTSDNINMWAKYKPVRENAGAGLAVTGMTSGSNYWQADDGFCGFEITIYHDWNLLKSALFDNGLTKWGRRKPLKYRPLDFDGYYHNAINPIGELGATTIYMRSDYSFALNYDIVEVDRTYNLSHSDLRPNGTPISSYYLSALMVDKTNTSRFHVLSSATTVGTEGGGVIDFVSTAGQSMQIFADKHWYFIPFYSSRQLTFDDVSMASDVLFSADQPMVELDIKSPGMGLACYANGQWNRNHTTVTFMPTIVNSAQSSRSVTNFSIYLYKGLEERGSLLIGEWHYSGGAITIQSGTYEYPSPYPTITPQAPFIYDQYEFYYAVATCDGGSRIKMQIEDDDSEV